MNGVVCVCDRSFVSEKETCLAWHFRDADPDFAFSQAMEARQHLEQALMETPLEVGILQYILCMCVCVCVTKKIWFCRS